MSSRHRSSGRDRDSGYSRRRSRSRSPDHRRRGKSPRRDDRDRNYSKSKSASSYQNNPPDSRNQKRKDPSPTIKTTKEEDESPSKQQKIEENIGEYQHKVEEQLLSMQKQESEEELLEKARKRRQAILEKYKASTETVTKSPDNVINDISKSNTTETPEPIKPIIESSPQSATELFVNEPAATTSDSSFDMFSASPSLDSNPLAKSPRSSNRTAAEIESDSQGYALLRPGELLGNRYLINAICGQGMFSRVLRARDNTDNSEVVIKVIRDNDFMKRVGAKEVEILSKINTEDPDSKYGIVKLLDHFHDRDFLCLVFEPMLCNLRELVYKFGGKNGISLKAVQIFSKKLLFSLALLRKLEVIHADIKPDNILVTMNKNSVRLADLGSSIPKNEVASFTGSIELVTGFYRSPEIILGLPITSDIDTWSLACTIYEMLTGKLLFKASSNNELLKKHIELMGMAELPRKLIKKSPYRSEHFDDQFLFLARKTDPITNAIYSQAISLVNPSRNLKEELLDNASESELKHIPVFYDLLNKMLALDPSKRLKPEEALNHPFYSIQL